MHSFLDMAHFDKIFFTSDLHAGHRKMLEIGSEHRHGETPAEMTAHMLDTINATAGPNDLIFVLGDVSFLSAANTMQFLNNIAANMVLVIGNHDWDLVRHQVDFVRRFALCADVLIQKMPDGEVVHMSHFPHMAWPKMRQGWYHLHGHLHGAPYTHDGRIADVGWDVWGRPVPWSELKALLEPRQPINHHGGLEMTASA